ncbi:hypothetical protein [Phreatobacter sp.]|uniref:hypothetical protein n=1 Tax=Phreatobacter sp. TaxID=1966341 RepID=UPI003F6E9B4A
MATRIRTALAALALAAGIGLSAPASAQVYYGGYNLGPNYGAMIEQQQQLARQQQQQMQQQQQQVIAQVMQHPNFGPMYQQHRAQGGQMSPQQFAYQLAATRWGSPEGIRHFQNSERANHQREFDSARGLRDAERRRGDAQMGWSNGYHRNNNEFGRTVQGNSTYVMPNGQTIVLPHTQPGVPQRDQHGRTFVMNNQGQYFMATPYGWQPMRPAH